MTAWLQKLHELQQLSIPCVMVTVASTVGSTPREVGSKMIVTADDLFATIGGGNLEFKACAIARDLLQSREPQLLKRFPLGAALGQCCGGLVNLLFEPIIGANDWVAAAMAYEKQGREWVREVSLNDGDGGVHVRRCDPHEKDCLLQQHCFVEVNRAKGFQLTLFGAGHVGRAIVNAISDLPVNIRWVDSRENQFPSNLPANVDAIVTDSPEAEVDAAASDGFFLVMTHDHSLDQLLSEAILQRDDFVYFGLIGSNSKRRMFETRMQRRGIDADRFGRMTCPIGIDGISGKQPAMIAISVVAQIVQVYDAHRLLQQKDKYVAAPVLGGVNAI